MVVEPGPDRVTLTHWGTYRPQMDGDRLTGMAPLPGDSDPSAIGASLPGALTHPARIAQPMVREGYLARGPASREGRGREGFVAVSWETATRLAAGALSDVRAAHGNAAIFGGSYGWASAGRFHHAQSQLHRFLNLCGGYTRSVNTHSHAAAEVLLPHVIGNLDGLEARATPWPLIAGHCELFVAFGGLAAKNAQVSAGGVGHHTTAHWLAECHRQGTRFVNIGPLRSDVAEGLAAEWLPVRPNTDTALMLGLAHVLVGEDLHDRDFLTRCTTGFETFLPYLMGEDGQPKDADWAAAICGIPAETIRALARRMAASRTMISVAWSLQRAAHGEQPFWMAITLAAMLGQIGLPGGGFGFGYGGANRVGLSDLPFAWPALPQGANPVRSFIPVARLADMLANPGAEFDYSGGRHAYPDIRLVWWAGGNPFHHQQDLGKLARAWRRPETVIVHEPWWNTLARHADIVFPCTTSLERNDLGIAKTEPYLVAMRQVVPPVGDARSDYDILTGIAAHLGLADAFTEGRDEMGWVRDLYARARATAAAHEMHLPPFDEFWQAGHIRLPDPPDAPPLMAKFRADPVRHKRATPSGRIEIFSATIDAMGYDDCPGHPVWLEPDEWLGGPAVARHPLHLISNQPATRLHSQLDLGAVSVASKIAGREPATLNPADAAARGIAAGDVVRIFNDRGACLAGAVLSDAVMPGVIQLATGAWADLEPQVTGGNDRPFDRHGNPNTVTLDRPTSRLSQAPIAHTTLVEVARLDGPPPPVRAFTPPPIRKETS